MANHTPGDARHLATHLAESFFDQVLLAILREPCPGEEESRRVPSEVPEQRIYYVAFGAGDAGFLASVHVDRLQPTNEAVGRPIVHFSGYDLATAGEPPDLPGHLHSEWYAMYSPYPRWRRLRDRGWRHGLD